jgi:hypothetical protein
MASTLGQVLRQIAKKKPETQGIKRVEVIGVMPDGTHLLASGEAAKVSGRAEFRPGEIVDVLSAPTPLILGHKWQKGDVPSVRVRQQLEEVEEIIITLDSHPDGGLDFFLRSWRGLFYLDLRAAVAAVVSDQTKYVEDDTRFPVGISTFVRFGQNDNTLSVASFGFAPQDFLVIYVFKINRPLASDRVPVISENRVVGTVEFPIVDLTLIGLYDFEQFTVPTGISISTAATRRLRQNLYFFENTANLVWDGDSYEASSIVFGTHEVQTVQDQSISHALSYDIVIDFAHNNLTPSLTPTPYAWNFRDFWIDAEDRPVLNVEIQQTGKTTSAEFDWKGYDDTGVLVPLSGVSGIPSTMWKGTVTAVPRDFTVRPTVIVRLTGDSISGAVVGVVLGKTCPDVISQSADDDHWINIPGFESFAILGGTLLGSTHQIQIRTGGGPIDGTTHAWDTHSFWNKLTSPPGGGTEVGTPEVEHKSPVSFLTSALAKPTLASLWRNDFSLGTQFDKTWYIQLSAEPQYLTHHVITKGFTVGTPPASIQRAITYGWSLRNVVDFDCLVYLVHTMAGAILGEFFRFAQEGVTGLWRVRSGEDSAIIYVAQQNFGLTTNWPNPLLSRRFVLLEAAALLTTKELRTIDNSATIFIPPDLQDGFNLAMLSPDRLFDKRETVKKFLSTSDPSQRLTTPKPMSVLSLLDGFEILDEPSRMIHTVGTRTRNE